MDCSRGLFNKITRLPLALATVIVCVGIGASDVSPQDAPVPRWGWGVAPPFTPAQ